MSSGTGLQNVFNYIDKTLRKEGGKKEKLIGEVGLLHFYLFNLHNSYKIPSV